MGKIQIDQGKSENQGHEVPGSIIKALRQKKI